MVMPPDAAQEERGGHQGRAAQGAALRQRAPLPRRSSGCGCRSILRYDEPAGMMVLEDLTDLTFEQALEAASTGTRSTAGRCELLAPCAPRAEREPRPGVPRLHPRLRRRPLRLGAAPLPRVGPRGLERQEAHRRRARRARPHLPPHRRAAGRRAARLHPPRLPEPQPDGEGRRAGGHRLPGRAPGARGSTTWWRSCATATSSSTGAFVDAMLDEYIVGVRAARRARASTPTSFTRVLRPAHRAAQAEGRGPLRVHQPGEGQPRLPASPSPRRCAT